MLALENVDVSYGHVRALRAVSFTLEAGRMLALFGANGAGKTTTLRVISGSVPLQSGAVVLDGRPTGTLAPERVAALGVAHIPEGRGVFARMSVRQNLKMGGYLQRLRARALHERIERVLDMFPILGERLEQQAGTLSGGEQQMLAIGRALVSQPRVLLLDEPSHGLAPKIVKQVFSVLSTLRDEGVSLLVVEQYANVALAHADDAVVLERGVVTYAGEAATLSERKEQLHGAYLGGAGA